MTPSPSNPPLPGATAAQVEPADIDASCRVPLSVLFVGATVWIVLASVCDLVVSIKFHSPYFLADFDWLTYGRVHAAATNALLYGFVLPAGLGVGLWIITQLGVTRVSQPWLVAVGGKIWNLGVLVGVLAILAGDSTGFENLEMPKYAALLLFLGYLPIGVWSGLTLHHRRRAGLSTPQWLLLAALFWFPWIYSTANLLLLVFPVRGVEQSAINWWYSGNLTVIWLSLVGLAAVFYFLGKDTRPAEANLDAESGTRRSPEPASRSARFQRAGGGGIPAATSCTGQDARAPAARMAAPQGCWEDYRPLFAFWTLILFGSWVGIPSSAPLPAWMPTLSTIASVLMIIPLLTVAVIVGREALFFAGRDALPRVQAEQQLDPTERPVGPEDRTTASLPFIRFGIAAWLIAGGMKIAAALPGISSFTEFTWFTVAQSQLNIYGFFAMTMFGAIYAVVPKVARVNWPLPKVVRAHFWCAAVGILLLVLPLAIGGVLQGIHLNNPQIAFMDVSKATLPFLRVSTMGNLLILLSNLLLLGNLLGLLTRCLWTHFVPIYKSLTQTPQPAEVKS